MLRPFVALALGLGLALLPGATGAKREFVPREREEASTRPAHTPAPPRVAIIGSGISGASAAYFLAHQRPDAHIVVFEREADVGGRTRTHAWHEGKIAVDEGATSVSSLNQYVSGWMAEFNISRASTPPSEMGIWDGSGFRLRADTDSALFALKLLWRYGTSPLRLRGALKETVANLTAVYALQAAGAAFADPVQLFRALGIYDSTQVTAAVDLARLGVSEAFTQEFVDGASRCNYLQSSAELNAFVNLVSLAGAAVEGTVFRVEGGTQNLTRQVLGAARARLRTGIEVVSIKRGPGGGYELATRATAAAAAEKADAHDSDETVSARSRRAAAVAYETFDGVVIAAPLEASELQIELDGVKPVPRKRRYVQTHATFVEAASLSASTFGADAARIVGEVLTVNNDSLQFVSIGLTALLPAAPSHVAADRGGCAAETTGEMCSTARWWRPARAHACDRAAGMRGIWKVFFKQPLSDEALEQLFDGLAHTATRRVVWDAPGAYPSLGPTEEWPPFHLVSGLAYAGAMESPVSCMETQAIAGRNAATLISQSLPPAL